MAVKSADIKFVGKGKTSEEALDNLKKDIKAHLIASITDESFERDKETLYFVPKSVLPALGAACSCGCAGGAGSGAGSSPRPHWPPVM